jgi:ABC-type lipoprotein release transport system permease subunit
LESALLGAFGWILGTISAWLIGLILSRVFQIVLQLNNDWKTGLANLNITSINIDFPWWLLLGTLVLAIVFTVLSGAFPALRAARQNPVEVLRSE